MQNNFQKMALFLSAIFFVLSCCVFFFFYRTIDNNNKESQSKAMEWQSEAKRRDEIKMLDHSVKMIEGERTELETHFAQSSDIVPFLNTIEGLASKVGAKAETTSVDISEDHKGLIAGLKASGDFKSLYKFLTLLENSAYGIEFISMDMQKPTGATDATGNNASTSLWDVLFKIKLLSFVP